MAVSLLVHFRTYRIIKVIVDSFFVLMARKSEKAGHGDSIFGSGFFPLAEFKDYQNQSRREYESHVYSCHPFSVGDRGHDIERHWAFLRSASKFSGGRSGKESGGRRRCLPAFL